MSNRTAKFEESDVAGSSEPRPPLRKDIDEEEELGRLFNYFAPRSLLCGALALLLVLIAYAIAMSVK